MKLAELAQKAEVPPRTIRLYITRGLLDGPLRRGRGAVYGQEHLARLRRIRQFQNQGRTLAEIGHLLAHRAGAPLLPSGGTWTRYEPAPDVIVWTRTDVPPWRNRHIRSTVARLFAELAASKKETDDGSRH